MTLRPSSLLLIGFLAACGSPVLNPYGHPYGEDNTLTNMELRGCQASGGLTKRPMLVRGTKPLYPVGQLLSDNTGYSSVDFNVSAEGKVEVVRGFSEQSGFFTSHAEIAMRDWLVEPAAKDGWRYQSSAV